MKTAMDGVEIDLREARQEPTRSLRYTGEWSRHRSWQLVGLVLLVIFNGLDVITTNIALDRGGVEGNPLARALIGTGTLGATKAILLIAVGWAMYQRPPKRMTTIALWCAVAFYACVLLENLYVIVATA
ncbi:MAG: DUF5658 family protein [Acidimicrobiia bacterium]